MSKYAQQVFSEFVEDLNSAKPAPGGGTAAALTGSMAAALSGMVAHMTTGKKTYAAVEEDMQALLRDSAALQKEMQLLADEDTEVFGEVLSAYKLPKSVNEKGEDVRTLAIQEASVKSIEVSFKIVECSLKVMELAEVAAFKGSRFLITDASASVILAHACAKVTAYNIIVNARALKEAASEEVIFSRLEQLMQSLAEKEATVLQRTEELL